MELRPSKENTKPSDQYDSHHFISRELSWLEFNHRVMEESRDKNNPLFERLKFLAIVTSNLDEFFMVRVASLKDQVNAGYQKPDPAGLTPKRQLKHISQRVHRMVKDQYNTFNKSLKPLLQKEGFYLLRRDQISAEQHGFLEDYFKKMLYPVLTPMAVDSSRPFPLILNRSLNIAMLVQGEEATTPTFATVQVPSVLPRVIELPPGESGRSFIMLEEIIMLFANRLFSGHQVLSAAPYRITRNADLTIEEEEAKDLLMEIEKSIKRRRWGAAIRLEIDAGMEEALRDFLQSALEIHKGEIYLIKGPLDLSFLMKINKIKGFDHLLFEPTEPVMPIEFTGEESIFDIIAKGDRFLHHPYDSFQPVVRFVQEAAADPKVLAIKQTLYRVSGDSPIIQALAEAAEAGKQVTVLVEVMARFDEENNILWAKKLEQAGCHVIYGLVGLKTHSKIILVVRKEEDRIKRYLHLGTGNYNDNTAKLYTDMGLLTCNEYYGAEASAFFNMLTGYSQPPDLYKLTVAPLNLRQTFARYIRREAEHARQGKKAAIIAQMNSLVDPHIITELYDASQAGVKVKLLVRGICCLRPGVEGVSENIEVRSIVGRFLEHPRIYRFYNDGEKNIYLSSADWMTRNLDRRVELMFEIENKSLKNNLEKILEIIFSDTQKTRILGADGLYKRVDRRGKIKLNAQEYFCGRAVEKNKQARKKEENKEIGEPITSSEDIAK
ncbi:RNA degradosome polyphosphate kinase [Tindallia californiensis]|uniref:Polyphosphate kinase n=1 Tax=Tindallia californiensis TaxID=159292 RepID=A0A1H3Q2Q1_9FIRM|nr:RNA degradosome polyphosphate kinase [Tindallia californiensis]SDZ07295.1 polyphosphate kinase [Tindallia californiensis]